MCSFCLLTSLELFVLASCDLLCLHSYDMNSLNGLFLKEKSCSCKYNYYNKPHICQHLTS